MNILTKPALTLLITCFVNQLFSQNFTARFIKTVTFNTQENINPIIPLGNKLKIGFDDLEGDQKSYRYFIQHCNYNWEVSGLQSTEYINGFQSFEILNLENSFGTYQNYTHHKFEIPNRNTRIKISGNYILTVMNDDDEICIQRRFVLYESQIVISGKVVRDRSLKSIDYKQVVNFSIIHPNITINNPSKEIKVVIVQNNDWNLAKSNIKPQYFKKNEIVYNYNAETSYFGNNEFLNFDTKNFNGTNVNISRSILKDHYYHSYLYPNIARNYLPYTYYPDINGGYVIRTLNGNEATVESEYTNVHLFLKSSPKEEFNESIYIYGAFNNYAFTEENRLKFNNKTNYLETEILFKQGFYSYTHVIKKESNEIDMTTVDGSYQETENNYTILVYYQPFGQRIGRIVGATTINSKN